MKQCKRKELRLTCLVVTGAAILIGIRVGIRKHRQSLERQLSMAMADDDAATVMRLLDRGITLRRRPRFPSTLVTAACAADAKRTLVALLGRGEHPGANDVAIPALRNDGEMAAILIKAGATPNPMAYGPYPLMIILAERRKTTMIKQLISSGADPDAAYLVTGYRPCGFTTLMISISVGDMESVRALLKAGAHVNARIHDHTSDLDGYSALMIAEKHKAMDEVALLLKSGAKIDTVASDKMTPKTLAEQDASLLKMLEEIPGGDKLGIDTSL